MNPVLDYNNKAIDFTEISKGTLLCYKNCIDEKDYYGIIVGICRNGVEVVVLNDELQPIVGWQGMRIDAAYFCHIVKIYNDDEARELLRQPRG